jgi:dephospho-CoA kinase
MSQNNATLPRIGIAGYMGAGKSACAKRCAEAAGMRIINADAEAKLLMENDSRIRDELVRVFGPSIDKSGALDFAALGAAAFASPADMQKLNNIVHPRLLRQLRDCVFSQPGPSVLDAALIPLWRIEDWFDRCLWIDAPSELRRSRLVTKTGMPEALLRQRMLVQETLVAEPSGAQWTTIVNDGTFEELKNRVDRFINGPKFIKR